MDASDAVVMMLSGSEARRKEGIAVMFGLVGSPQGARDLLEVGALSVLTNLAENGTSTEKLMANRVLASIAVLGVLYETDE